MPTGVQLFSPSSWVREPPLETEFKVRLPKFTSWGIPAPTNSMPRRALAAVATPLGLLAAVTAGLEVIRPPWFAVARPTSLAMISCGAPLHDGLQAGFETQKESRYQFLLSSVTRSGLPA